MPRSLRETRSVQAWDAPMLSATIRAGKQVVRRQLNAWGWEVGRRTATIGPTIPLLKLMTEHTVLSTGPGAVLQIGANTGDDALHEIITDLKLPALLVEPLPDIFETLKLSYEGEPYVTFENCAVSTQPGELQIYRVSRTATHLPSWTQALASIDKSVLLSHKNWKGISGKNLEKYIEASTIKVKTVGDLIATYPFLADIILMQVDTEGHDLKVIRSAIDAKCRPKIILYEHKHLSYEDQCLCRQLLAENGYSFTNDPSDTLAYREYAAAKSAWAPFTEVRTAWS